MKMLEKILVATDFGRSAGDALKTAEALASAFGSKVILIHVIPQIPGSPVNLRTLKTASRERLRKLKSQLTRAGVRTGDSVAAVGSPFDQIIQLSELLDVNVIVLGSGDGADADMCPLGFTPERLLRKASKPIWVVKAGALPVFKRILCAVDFSEPSARALTNAIHLARIFEAELTVLTVTQTLADLYVTNATLALEAQSKFLRQEERRFDEFLKQFDFTDVQWTKAMQRGVPEREILKLAREWSANLLIMGSVGRTGLARILVGSVAGKVIRGMPCSVITVKSEHAIRLQLEAEIADIELQWKRGQELLGQGFPLEAMRQFESCLAKDKFYAPALQGLAEAHARLGHLEESEMCSHRAKYIREKVLQDRIEAEIRSRHPL